MKKKDQRYQRIGQGELETNGSLNSNQNVRPYRDKPSESIGNTDEDDPLSSATRLQQSQSSSSSTNDMENRRISDGTGGTNENLHLEQQNPNNGDIVHRKQLRMRRTPSSNMSPPSSRSGSMRKLPMSPLSREGSSEKLVVLEGDIGFSPEHLNGNATRNGSFSSVPPSSRIKQIKNSNDEDDSSSSGGEEERENGEGGGSQGEDGDDLIFSASNGSSFDLLDDEDEINLQRYNRDFGASPFASNYRGENIRWNEDAGAGMDNSFNMYHPRSDTTSTGSNSKDPWIRMVQQHNQQSPTNGNMPFSSINSISDLLLYLQGIRRQARQRRAQRLLTMHSEQWSERIQFWFMTYCWDVTDVGLLVIAILFVVWFTGLLWIARVKARRVDADASNNESQSGAEYNANAEFDDYEKSGGSPLYLLFQWLWWALGVILLLRILGPFAVYNVNNRRRERRRQRFMSGNMDQQQRRMQQQQLPTIVAAAYSDDEGPEARDGSVSGLEITETRSSPYTSEAPSSVEGMNIT